LQTFLSDLLNYPFLQYALLAGALASLATGVVGPFIAAKRITYIAGGIAHCVLAGLGAAFYLNKVHGLTWLDPLLGATIAALLAAGIIAIVSLRGGQKEDTIIGALWAVGMAVGVIFISLTPGYNQELMSYLFGNILMVSPGQIKLLIFLDLIVLLTTLAFYSRFLAVCFDEEFSRIRGVAVEFYYVILLGLTALTVVALVTVVGIVMAIALITLPTAIAGAFTRVLWKQMVVTTLLGILFTSLGLALSYEPELPAGATIVTLAGIGYILTLTIKKLASKRKSRAT
jgi:zinc transport system permease protein